MHHTSSPRHTLVFLLVAFALLPHSFLNAAPSRQDQAAQPAYAAGEVVIGWQPGTGPVREVPRQAARLGTDRADPDWQAAASEISRSTGLPVLSAVPEHGIARLRVTPGTESGEIARLSTLPWVRYAELNYYAYGADTQATDASAGVRLSAPALYPSDPDFPRQWNLHRVDAPNAWSVTRGSLSFVVAVLDTGVAQGHPDFAGQLLQGYNYVVDQQGAEDDDPYSHGTHVTGILAARMNNGQGVAGLAPDIKILPLKVLDSQRKGRYDAVGAAIRDAADRRAQIINLSLAGPFSQLLQDAVTYAQVQGALVVAAAGNCAQDPSNCWGQINPNIYPAAYPGVLAVAASDRFDRATPYSGYKPYIGLATPGGTASEQVWSTTRTGYGPMFGTSMSTPTAAAAAALVWTLRPTASPAEIAEILKSTADQVGTDPYSGEPLAYAGGRNDYFGSGRLNAANAVRWVYPPSISSTETVVNLLLGGPVSSVSRSLQIENPSGQGVYWQATILPGAPWLSLTRATGTSLYNSPASLTLAANRLDLAPGLYVGTIRVQPAYPAGLAPAEVRVQLRVAATVTRTYAPLVTQGHEATWLDPEASGVLTRRTLPLTNDSLMTVALPFPVSFYGVLYPSLQVSDNGLVTFASADSASAKPPAACPGNGMSPNSAIYVLGYDWNPSLGGKVIMHQPDPNSYVITWQDVRRAGSATGQSFQLVMTSDSRFRGNYRTVESPAPGLIGTESYDAAFSQRILCNGAGRQVSNGDSVRFETRLPW